MRKLIALIALSTLVGSAFAGDFLGLSNFEADGSLEVLGVQANNETDIDDSNKDSRGATITRVRVGVNMDVTEDVSGRIELTRNGENGAVSQYGDGASSIDNETASIVFQNAYVDLANFLGLDNVRLGRQYVGRQGDILLFAGPVNDDLLSISSIDALHLAKKVGPVDILFVTGKAAEDDGVPTSGTETDANGAGEINLTYGSIIVDALMNNDNMSLPLELGYYQGTNARVGNNPSDNTTITIMDLRADFKAMEDRLTLGAQYMSNGGQQNTGPSTEVKYKGSATNIMAAWDASENRWGIKGLLAAASGDDTVDAEDKSFRDYSAVGASASDMRFGEIWSNSNTFAAAAGIGGAGLDTGAQGPGLNVSALKAYYTLPVMEQKWKLLADYYMIKSSKDIPGTGSKKLGNELDLIVDYAHSETVSATAGYAMLTPKDGFTGGTAPDDDITKLWAKLNVKFGNQD